MAASEYWKERRDRSSTVYWPTLMDLRARKEQARLAGFGSDFSAWVVQMVANAISGSVFPPEYVESLKQEVERLRRWLETAREETEEYRKQNRRLQEQREKLIVLLHGLPTGAEVVARFLQQEVQA